VIRADLHNTNFLTKALILTLLCWALLISTDLFVATTWDHVWFQGHILRGFHCWGAETTSLVTQSLRFTIWVPVIVSLVVSVPLLE
jgi:hypothetical protein